MQTANLRKENTELVPHANGKSKEGKYWTGSSSSFKRSVRCKGSSRQAATSGIKNQWRAARTDISRRLTWTWDAAEYTSDLLSAVSQITHNVCSCSRTDRYRIDRKHRETFLAGLVTDFRSLLKIFSKTRTSRNGSVFFLFQGRTPFNPPPPQHPPSSSPPPHTHHFV